MRYGFILKSIGFASLLSGLLTLAYWCELATASAVLDSVVTLTAGSLG